MNVTNIAPSPAGEPAADFVPRSIAEIQARVAAHFELTRMDMVSARRARAVARPRQLAMYLSKRLTPRSLPEIGRRFGGRDHSTVIHAVKTIEAIVAAAPESLFGIDRDVADAVAGLEAALRPRSASPPVAAFGAEIGSFHLSIHGGAS